MRSSSAPRNLTDPGIGYTPSDDDIAARIRLSPAARWVLDYYPVDVLKETKTGTEIRFTSADAEIPGTSPAPSRLRGASVGGR